MARRNTIHSRKLRHGMRAGLILATSVLRSGPAIASPTAARTAMGASQTVQRIELDAERVHAGSIAADIERLLGQPTLAIALGVPGSSNVALFHCREPVRTRVILDAGRVTSVALDLLYIDPAPLPTRAGVIKPTMPRDTVTRLVGVPTAEEGRTQAGLDLERLTFARAEEPEFSVFLVGGLVVDVRLGRERPPGLVSVTLPVASTGGELAVGLDGAQVAPARPGGTDGALRPGRRRHDDTRWRRSDGIHHLANKRVMRIYAMVTRKLEGYITIGEAGRPARAPLVVTGDKPFFHSDRYDRIIPGAGTDISPHSSHRVERRNRLSAFVQNSKRAWSGLWWVVPGIALCVTISVAAIVLEHAEKEVFGRAWLDAIVLAILLGTAVRTMWVPGRLWRMGISVGAKLLLEIAVVLLGFSLSSNALAAAGPWLVAAVAGVVVAAISVSYAIARLLRLPHRMAVLVACGNSICGNSAIAAVAPVIGATGEDVAASIAFTAVLGVVVVFALPLLGQALHLSALQYGAVAGLTVYAVPQVIAATAPAGTLAVQFGTMVKLARVLMLGPVVVALSLLGRREPAQISRPALHRLVPWFIVGFVGAAAARSAGIVPDVVLAPASAVAAIMTIVSMAALGLGTDVRSLARSGVRVAAAVTLSLVGISAISFFLVRIVGLV
jgi:uncharacterized integral membrane protein (TIGR00698 family)